MCNWRCRLPGRFISPDVPWWNVTSIQQLRPFLQGARQIDENMDPLQPIKKKKQVVKTEADPARHCFSSPFTVKVKLWQLQPTLNYAGSRQGDHYVTSAAPPSAGKLIACSSVWLALNERMWVTMSFSPGAMTVGGWGVGGGRSWIWNNETVNALHHNYWFPQVYILCPWFSSTTVTVHT